MNYKIGVLTSGGDAPGMNAAIRAVIRSGIAYGYQMFAILEGFRGIVEDKITEVDRTFVSEILMRGGTILKTTRYRDFFEEATQKKAASILQKHGISHLIVIGGDGTYRGAHDLSKFGIKVIGIPATIDNDVMGTEQSIGFDTALNTITESVDKLRDTSRSHHRCSLIEVMGNKCGDLALYAGTASGVDLIISPEYQQSEEQIIDTLKAINLTHARHALVLVSEKQFDDLNDLKTKIIEQTGFDTKIEVLGRVQRGGTPSASDRVIAARYGTYAISLIHKNITNVCVGLIKGRLTYTPIREATKTINPNLDELINVITTLK